MTVHKGSLLQRNSYLNNPYMQNLSNNNNDLLNLNQIGFRKLYSLDAIDSAMSDFRAKVKNLNNHKSIASPIEMILRISCCDQISRKRKVYSRTVRKIREYLDVNNIIKAMIELQNLKGILFSKNMLEVFKSFSDLKTLKEDKVEEIHFNLKQVYENINNPDYDQNNNIVVGEEKVKDMDHYAAQYFIENFMKK